MCSAAFALCRALRQVSSHAGVCLRKPGERGTNAVHQQGAFGGRGAPNNWRPVASKDRNACSSIIFLKHAPMPTGHWARGSVGDDVHCP